MTRPSSSGIVQHTAGPWREEQDDRGVYRIVSTASEATPQYTVALAIRGAGFDSDPIEANARLIAAAPEMLEALRQIQDLASDDDQDRLTQLDAIHDAAYDVISKVEGRES